MCFWRPKPFPIVSTEGIPFNVEEEDGDDGRDEVSGEMESVEAELVGDRKVPEEGRGLFFKVGDDGAED